jgi:hypothetical protein
MSIMGKRGNLIATFVTALVGVLVGVFVSTGLRHGSGESKRPDPNSEVAASRLPSPSFESSGLQPVRLSSLEERVNRLETVDASVGNRAPREAPEPAEPRREEYEMRHATLLSAYEKEAVDPGWAPGTERLFQSDLNNLQASGQFQVRSLGCRMTSCAVTLEWNSLEQASGHFRDILHYPFRAGCAREILVSERPSAGGKYEATAIFDCTDWRANGAEAMPVAPPVLAVNSKDPTQ